MHYHKLLNFLLLVVLLNIQTVGQTTNQSSIYGTGELYDLILDSVFPRDAMDVEVGFGLVLRYRPSFDAESQITVNKKGGKFTITEYRVTGESIYSRIQDLESVDAKQASQIAAQIPVTVKVRSVNSKEFEIWMNEFYTMFNDSLRSEKLYYAKNPNEILQVEDGTRYELWYRGRFQLYYRRQGTNLNYYKKTEDRVINWMKQVSRYVEKKTK